jgi:hypothetical protein
VNREQDRKDIRSHVQNNLDVRRCVPSMNELLIELGQDDDETVALVRSELGAMADEGLIDRYHWVTC